MFVASNESTLPYFYLIFNVKLKINNESQSVQTILKITPFSNTTAEPDETTTYATTTDNEDYIDLNELIERVQQNTTNEQGFTFHFICVSLEFHIHFIIYSIDYHMMTSKFHNFSIHQLTQNSNI